MTTAPIPVVPDEWDDDTLALLKDSAPVTTSDLVLVPRYTQSEWDRRQVAQLKAIGAAAAHMRDNLDVKTPEVLLRDAMLMLGCDRMAAAFMSPDGPGTTTAADEGTVYAVMLARAGQKPRGPDGRFIARDAS